MPWEKSFDTDQAIDRAMHVFWSKGYDSTSLADLLLATGLNKGSFYNAFGSKKQLFTDSLLKYNREQTQAILKQLASTEDPVGAITTLFDALIQQSVSDSELKGCMLVNTALDLPHHDEDTRKTVKCGLNQIEAFFKQHIEIGRNFGTISPAVDPVVTSKALLTLAVGLRVLARGVFERDGLCMIKAQAIDLIG